MKNKLFLSIVALVVTCTLAVPSVAFAAPEDITTDVTEEVQEGDEEPVEDPIEVVEMTDEMEKPDEDTLIVEGEETVEISGDFGEDSYNLSADELLMGYIYREVGLYDKLDSSISYNGYAARENLSSAEKVMYDTIRAMAEKVARGQQSTPTFSVGLTGFGYSSQTTLEKSLRKAVLAVKYDCPYDFYWADLSWGGSLSRSGGYYSSMTITIKVNANYSTTGASMGTAVNTSKAAATQGIITNAQSIVASCASFDDYDKLKYYADLLCAWIDYNHPAVDYDYDYGDPWQLIWALDGDPSTKVVCEGYSKAFQFLCDLSTFQSGYTRSIIVAGDMRVSGSGGAHMWNVVRMDDGRNYLVDTTNMDGNGDFLFLAPACDRNGNYIHYIMSPWGTKWYFNYDSDVRNMYAASELTLSSTPYVKPIPKKNGLCMDDFGNYYLYVDDVFQSTYTDMYCDAKLGWVKVVNGVADFYYNDLYFSPSIGWWKIKGGFLDTTYNDLYNSPTMGWWKVTNGALDLGYNDLYYSPTVGWWKIANGTLDLGFNDLYYSPTYGWWKIKNGSLDTGYTDFYFSPTYGWWKVYGGALDTVYTDLYYSPTMGWWKVNGGAIDLAFTDLYYSPTYGWWKVNGGSLDIGYTDLYYSPTYGWWKVYGGALDTVYTDLYCSPTMGWWKVNGGAVDLNFNDLYQSPTIGWWKVKNGTIDLGYTGLYTSPTWGGPYNIVNGQLR